MYKPYIIYYNLQQKVVKIVKIGKLIFANLPSVKMQKLLRAPEGLAKLLGDKGE